MREARHANEWRTHIHCEDCSAKVEREGAELTKKLDA